MSSGNEPPLRPGPPRSDWEQPTGDEADDTVDQSPSNKSPSAGQENLYDTQVPKNAGSGTAPVVPAATAGASRSIGNYLLLRRLGAGGMGEVFLAQHQRFRNRRYALKLIRPGLASPDAIARFEREIEAMGTLSHPNLIFATDAGVWEQQLYLVMEFVDGLDLGNIMHATGAMTVSEACEVVRQIATGVATAHEAGIVHRDIKPSNIMVSREGEVKLLDMGMASLDTGDETHLTQVGTVLGTAAYMAPEQWRDASTVSRAADVYSLGCTLYGLLTGKPPFNWEERNQLTDLMHRHLKVQAAPASDRNPDVPEALSEIVASMLAKSPEERPANAAAVAEVLEPFCGSGRLDHVLGALGHAEVEPAKAEGLAVPIAGDGQDPLRWSRNLERTQPSYRRIGATIAVLSAISIPSLAMAYYGPGTTEAWTQRWDLLGPRAVPPGTGFVIELVRILLYITLTCFLVGIRFTASIREMFNPRIWNGRLLAARAMALVPLAFFLIAEINRHLQLDRAPTDMVRWAEMHGLETTAQQEAVPYFWYLPYTVVNYVVVFGGLFAFPLIRFWAYDFTYMLNQGTRFELLQSSAPTASDVLTNLHRFAHECRGLTSRYVDTLGVLCIGIHYEYWVGRLTLSDAGLQTAILGWFVVGFAAAFVLAVSAVYGRGYQASSQSLVAHSAVDQQHALERFNLAWFLKTTIVSQLGGVLLLSLLAVGVHAAVSKNVTIVHEPARPATAQPK